MGGEGVEEDGGGEVVFEGGRVLLDFWLRVSKSVSWVCLDGFVEA